MVAGMNALQPARQVHATSSSVTRVAIAVLAAPSAQTLSNNSDYRVQHSSMTDYYSALGASDAPSILGQYSLGLLRRGAIITRFCQYNRVPSPSKCRCCAAAAAAAAAAAWSRTANVPVLSAQGVFELVTKLFVVQYCTQHGGFRSRDGRLRC